MTSINAYTIREPSNNWKRKNYPIRPRLRCKREKRHTKLKMDSIGKILTLYPLFQTIGILNLNGYRRLDPKCVAVLMTIRVKRRLIAQL